VEVIEVGGVVGLMQEYKYKWSKKTNRILSSNLGPSWFLHLVKSLQIDWESTRGIEEICYRNQTCQFERNTNWNRIF